MPNVIYSGEGNYSPETLAAVYNVYLPVLTKGSYKFRTDKVYNFSSSNYPNTIMIFMEIIGGDNSGFTGTTNEPGTPVNFSIATNALTNIDTTCTTLNTTKDINVIIMHDDEHDTAYAMLNYYNTAPKPPKSTAGKGTLESATVPRKIGSGILKPIKLK